MRGTIVGALATLMLAACGGQEQPNKSESAARIIPAPEEDPAPAVPPNPTSSPRAPNYAESDGGRYLYITAVSDEDRKMGKAAGRVVMYEYLGLKGGKHRLRSIAESGQALSTWECSDPCRIIKSVGTPAERIPYEPASIIGSAFEDALAGRLEPVDSGNADREETVAATTITADRTIPAQFQGEWNEQLEHCGTALNDTRLRIAAHKISFYESDAEVKSVTIKSAQAIQVVATLTGEGQVWTDRFDLVLSRSGDDLSMGELSRHRCK